METSNEEKLNKIIVYRALDGIKGHYNWIQVTYAKKMPNGHTYAIGIPSDESEKDKPIMSTFWGRAYIEEDCLIFNDWRVEDNSPWPYEKVVAGFDHELTQWKGSKYFVDPQGCILKYSDTELEVPKEEATPILEKLGFLSKV